MISIRSIIFNLFILATINSFSQTLYVDSAIATSGNGGTWSTAFASLGDALDSAHKNPAIDSILVAKGTYYPNHYPYNMNSSMIGVEFNTGSPKHRTFHIRTGLEVYGGYPSGGGPKNIANNRTYLKGLLYTTWDTIYHVVYLDTSENWMIPYDTTFLYGFIIQDGHASDAGMITINNKICDNLNGAGIYVNKGTHIIRNCNIYNNFAFNFGGGVFLDSCNIVFCQNRVELNVVQSHGAGISSLNSNTQIKDNFINYNRSFNYASTSYPGEGGGVFYNGGINNLYNNIIINNIAKIYGGGISTREGIYFIVNNTFCNNKADFLGGAFNSNNLAINYLYNNIFWKNKESYGSFDSLYADIYNKSATIIAKNNLFQLDSAQISTLTLAAGSQKNIYKVNPQFKGGLGIDSLSLLPTSPLIDKGDSSLYTLTDKLDYLLADRIQNNNIDIGAIETYTCISIVDISDTICFGDSISFGGVQRKSSGIYKDTFLNSLFCDSIVTLNLIVKPISTSSVNASICNGETYLFNGNNLSVSGTYNDTLISTTGCDSFITLNLTVKPTSSSTIITSICSGSTYLFNAKNLTVSGSYLDTLVASNGCDSIITLNLTVKPISSSTINKSVCGGASFSFNGNKLSTSGIYKDTLIAANGCDSFITLNFTVLPIASSTINISLCKGKAYLFKGIQRSTSGMYKDTLMTINGCDSIVTLNLTILNPPIITFIDSSNFATVYSWRTKTYTSAGTYYDTLKASNTCDTIYKLILNLIIPQPPAARPLQINYSNGILYASIDSATSYQWYLCGPPMKKITGANKQYFQVSDKSKYTVVVTKNGKTDTASCASNSSINTLASSVLSYYPNPVLNKFTIELASKLNDVIIDIYDLEGRKLWTKNYVVFQNTELNLQSFTKGIYIIKLQSSNGFNQVLKIVKEDE